MTACCNGSWRGQPANRRCLEDGGVGRGHCRRSVCSQLKSWESFDAYIASSRYAQLFVTASRVEEVPYRPVLAQLMSGWWELGAHDVALGLRCQDLARPINAKCMLNSQFSTRNSSFPSLWTSAWRLTVSAYSIATEVVTKVRASCPDSSHMRSERDYLSLIAHALLSMNCTSFISR